MNPIEINLLTPSFVYMASELGVKIKNSNILHVLSSLEQLKIKIKECNSDLICEDEIIYIENKIKSYVTKYEDLGHLITQRTKLYYIIEVVANRNSQTQYIKELGTEIFNQINNSANINSDTIGKRATARQMIDADRLKKSLKRKFKG
ncbi:hypothetical protein [Sphingobacterium endophyticum]|uniref:hypothetical protein n=1 Tax=Sphingobacterium endophyticum TaxID=2546448 RepID=UPI0012E28731|nr:hypothetical protein [Sphingobacterium endophyticum]